MRLHLIPPHPPTAPTLQIHWLQANRTQMDCQSHNQTLVYHPQYLENSKRCSPFNPTPLPTQWPSHVTGGNLNGTHTRRSWPPTSLHILLLHSTSYPPHQNTHVSQTMVPGHPISSRMLCRYPRLRRILHQPSASHLGRPQYHRYRLISIQRSYPTSRLRVLVKLHQTFTMSRLMVLLSHVSPAYPLGL